MRPFWSKLSIRSAWSAATIFEREIEAGRYVVLSSSNHFSRHQFHEFSDQTYSTTRFCSFADIKKNENVTLKRHFLWLWFMDLNQNDFCHVSAQELQFHPTSLPSSIFHLSGPILASIPKLMQKIARKCSISEIAFNCANFPPPCHPALQFHICLIPFVPQPSREILNCNVFYFPCFPGSVFNLRFDLE